MKDDVKEQNKNNYIKMIACEAEFVNWFDLMEKSTSHF